MTPITDSGDFYFNAGFAPISQAMLTLLLMRTGLQWEMHPAQIYSLGVQVFRATVETVKELTEEHREMMPTTTGITLFGLPVVLKESYPMSLIRLMYKGEEVSRIEALAIPCGWGFDNKTWEEQQKSEQEKMQKIGFRSIVKEAQ